MVLYRYVYASLREFGTKSISQAQRADVVNELSDLRRISSRVHDRHTSFEAVADSDDDLYRPRTPEGSYRATPMSKNLSRITFRQSAAIPQAWKKSRSAREHQSKVQRRQGTSYRYRSYRGLNPLPYLLLW